MRENLAKLSNNELADEIHVLSVKDALDDRAISVLAEIAYRLRETTDKCRVFVDDDRPNQGAFCRRCGMRVESHRL